MPRRNDVWAVTVGSPGSCPSCGADDWRPEHTSRRTRLATWLQTGHRPPPVRTVCGSCGAPGLSGGAYLVRSRVRWWSVPWRVLRVLLRRRRIWPAPYLYVVALGVGLAVGGSLAVVVGPAWWWLVALAPPILAWVGFLMTASGGRDPTNDLLTDLLREIDPERHHRRYERRRAELFRHAPFPLYGLPPSWTGPRWLGGDETSDRTIVALELAHGNPDDGWLRVEMRSAPHEPDRTGLAHELWREAHPPPLDLPPARFGAWAEEQERAASSWQPEWEPVEIRVDERPIAGARIHAGDRFVVAVPIGGGTIVIRGVRWDPDWLELVSITDLDPYVEGPARARES